MKQNIRMPLCLSMLSILLVSAVYAETESGANDPRWMAPASEEADHAKGRQQMYLEQQFQNLKRIKTVPIQLSDEFKRHPVDGEVILWLDVAADGHVSDARIHRSSGNYDLDMAVQRAARQFVYQPYVSPETAEATSAKVQLVYGYKVDSNPVVPVHPEQASQPEIAPGQRLNDDELADGQLEFRKLKMIKMVRPQFSDGFNHHPVAGAVTLWIDVGADGHVTHVRMLHSSGNADLDNGVAKAAQQFIYEPYIDPMTGKAGPTRTRLTVNYTVNPPVPANTMAANKVN